MSKRAKRKGKRAAGSYLSTDPAKRAAQIGNLRRVPSGIGGRPVAHGGYAAIASERIDEKAREIFEAIAGDAPLRDPDGSLPRADSIAVQMLSEALVRLGDVTAHLRDYGAIDQKTGAVKPAVEVEARLRREVADWLREMGMTPRARAALGLDVVRAAQAFDLAEHWSTDEGPDAAA